MTGHSSGEPCPVPRWVPSLGRHVRCKRRTCPSCGYLWAGDQRTKLLANVAAYGGDVALVTTTAPGRPLLPHDEDGQVLRPAAELWNKLAPSRWRELHRLAAISTRRAFPRAGWKVVARTWEYQRRGVLHVHVVVPMGSAAERAASNHYVNTLHQLRRRYVFGFVDRGKRRGGRRSLEVIPSTRAGRYLAKYLAPVEGGKLALTETVRRRDVPRSVVYVGSDLTQWTGVTMRYLRRVRFSYVCSAILGMPPGEALQLLERGVDLGDAIKYVTLVRGP